MVDADSIIDFKTIVARAWAPLIENLCRKGRQLRVAHITLLWVSDSKSICLFMSPHRMSRAMTGPGSWTFWLFQFRSDYLNSPGIKNSFWAGFGQTDFNNIQGYGDWTPHIYPDSVLYHFDLKRMLIFRQKMDLKTSITTQNDYFRQASFPCNTRELVLERTNITELNFIQSLSLLLM